MAQKRHNGEGSIERLPNGKFRLVISYTDPLTRKQKKVSKVADTEAEAWTFAEGLRASADARTQGVAPRSYGTVGEWLTDWLRLKKASPCAPATIKQYGDMIRRYLIPVLGAVPFEELKSRRLRLLIKRADLAMQTGDAGLPGPVSDHGRCHAIVTLQVALNESVELGILEQNHARQMKKPRWTPREPSCWTAAEAAAFLAHPAVTGHRLRALFRLGLDAGMRQGELLALRWDAIEWKTATVTVRKSLEEINSRQREKEPKTRKVRRIIVDAGTVAALRGHQERMAAEGHDTRTGPVFVTEAGRWIRKPSLWKMWQRLVQQSGARRIRPNDMRHSCASMLLRGGASIRAVADRLGHADPAVTLRVYAHCLPDDQAAVAALSGRLLGPNG